MIAAPKHRLAWRLRATFAGQLPPKRYTTPDIRRKNPGWGDEVFSRVIERVEFFLPTGHVLLLSGMEQYNFFVEAVQPMGGGGAHLAACWLCGKRPGRDQVDMWRVGGGKVIHDVNPWGVEWHGNPTRGWKPGVPGRPFSGVTGGR